MVVWMMDPLDYHHHHQHQKHRKSSILSLPALPLPPPPPPFPIALQLPTVKLSTTKLTKNNNQTSNISTYQQNHERMTKSMDTLYEQQHCDERFQKYRLSNNRYSILDYHQPLSSMIMDGGQAAQPPPPNRSYPNLSTAFNMSQSHYNINNPSDHKICHDLSPFHTTSKYIRQFPKDYLPYTQYAEHRKRRNTKPRSNSFDVVARRPWHFDDDDNDDDQVRQSNRTSPESGTGTSQTTLSSSTKSTGLLIDQPNTERRTSNSLVESQTCSSSSSSASSSSLSCNQKEVPASSSSSSSSSTSIPFDERTSTGQEKDRSRHMSFFRTTYPHQWLHHYFPGYYQTHQTHQSLFHRSSTPSGQDKDQTWCYGLIRSCGCCLLVMLIVLVLLSLSIVLGFSLYLAVVTNLLHPDMTFAYGLSGNFKVTSGDNFTIRLLNQSSDEFRKKSNKYEQILNQVVHSSLLSESILHTEIYTFRHGSLIVFFRIYSLKSRFDELLSVKKSKTIINFGTIENIYLDDEVIVSRVKQVIRDAFKRTQLTNQTQPLTIDYDTIKLSQTLERLTEPQYRERLLRKTLTRSSSTSIHHQALKNHHKPNQDEDDVESIINRIDFDDDGSTHTNQSTLDKTKTTTTTTISTPSTNTSTTTTTISSTSAISTPPTTNINTSSNISSTSVKPSNASIITNNNLTSTTTTTTQAPPTSPPTQQSSPIYVPPIHHLSLPPPIIRKQDTSTIGTSISTSTSTTTTSTTSMTSTTITTTSKPSTNGDLLIAWNELNPNDGFNIQHHSTNNTQDGLNNNRLDNLPPPYLLEEPEGREEPDDDDEVKEGEVTTTPAITTTITTLQNNDTTEPIGSIDGFVLVDQTTTTTPNDTTTTTNNDDNKDSTTPNNNKVLIISEDSFDLYSLGGDNSSMITTTTELTDYDDDDDDDDPSVNIEHEFKLRPHTKPPKLPKRPPSPSISSEGMVTSTPSIDDQLNNSTVIENEFNTQPQSPPSIAYGTRISKKLNFTKSTLNKIHHDDHDDDPNSSHHNSIHNHHFNKIDKTSTTTSTTTTTTPPPPISLCKFNEFQCANDSNRCIAFESVCNRVLDCLDGSDELHCRCADYLLRDESHRHKLCDGTIDCADLSDETSIACEPRCREGMFVCTGPSNQCIPMDRVCDGENDCANGDDEQNCITLLDKDQPRPDQDATLVQNHNPSGILHIQHHGQWAPLCFDSYDLPEPSQSTPVDSENWINTEHYRSAGEGSTANVTSHSSSASSYTTPNNKSSSSTSYSISSMIQIDDMGQAVCRANYFAHLERIEIVKYSPDDKTTATTANTLQPKFFAISSKISSTSKATLSLWSSLFEKVACKQGKVARIECSTIECGIRPISSKLQRRIIGGQSSSFGSWPWQVALYREGEFQCGAVVIDSQWLLTAAHCFYSSPGAYWTARSGVLRRGSLHRTFHEEIRRIERVFIHPEYVDKGFLNDIAMLRLDKPLVFSKYIRPICLPEEDDSQIHKWNNQLCTTVGWGKLYEHGRIFPDTLQEVKLPIISTEECRKRTLFLPLYKITDNMFCAGFEHGGRDACLGDSGGPMMCQKDNGKWILLGITSNGDGCGRANRPGVYTKVYNYLPWIRSILVEGRAGRGMESDQPSISKANLTTQTTNPCTSGHRCPLGKCLKPEQICDQIIDCLEDSSDERHCP